MQQVSMEEVLNQAIHREEISFANISHDEPTKIKIWHYQDSTELICLLSGDAVLIVSE